MKKINIHYDAETNDVDDYFTICMLASHPLVNLVSITLLPGSAEQVGLIKTVLNKSKCNAVIGVPDNKKFTYQKTGRKPDISAPHYRIVGNFRPDYSAKLADEVLLNTFTEYPDCVLVTGAALTNIAKFLKKHEDIKIRKAVVQGGFAGCNIVKEEDILDKFKGKETCKTWNLNQDIQSASYVLGSDRIKEIKMVSKNVCHGNIYSEEVHNKVLKCISSYKGLELIHDGMAKYYGNKKYMKAFHDPLAAAIAIDESIGLFVNVFPYHTNEGYNSEWGVTPTELSRISICVKADYNKFVDVMTNSIVGV